MKFKLTVFIIVLFACLMPLTAEDIVGEIAYLEGDIEITRDGEILEFGDIDLGMEIENYDLIQTYDDGSLSITLSGSNTPKAELVISPGTVFSIELENIEKGSKTSVDLMSGGLSLKVQKLSGSMELDVHTEAASMGVRGTAFTVEASPGGELLIACDEGSVECRSGNKKLFAQPGQTVEHTRRRGFRRIPVAVTELKKYRKEWMAEQIGVFKADALKAIKQYAGLYDKHYNKFNENYKKLVSNKNILEKWYKEDADKRIGANMEVMKEKKKIVGVLFDLRKTLFIYEKVYYRVAELYGYYQKGYGKGFVKPGVTVKAFFNKFARQRKELKKKMAVVKHVTKMFARRNKGSFAVDSFNDDDDDDFFDDDGW